MSPALLAPLAFVLVSLYSGRVLRQPFDDEVYTLNLVDGASVGEISRAAVTGLDVHPLGAYVPFALLRALGLPDWGLHAASLLVSATAAALAAAIVMRLAERLLGRAPSTAEGTLLALATGLAPLLVAQGDVLRWYPLFALLTLASVTLLLRGAHRSAGLLLGASASVNVIGFVDFAAIALVVATCPREGGLRRALAMLPPFALAALPGAINLAVVLHKGMGADNLVSLPRAVTLMVTGFVGGQSLGLVQSVPVTVALAALVVLARRQAWRAVAGDFAWRLVAALFAVAVALTLAGLWKPRSVMYLAPLFAGILAAMLLAARDLRPATRSAAIAVLVLVQLVALPNLRGNDTPYKRSTTVPVENVLGLLEANGAQHASIWSIDPAIARAARGRLPLACVAETDEQAARCPETDRIVLVLGHSSSDGLPEAFVERAARRLGPDARRVEVPFGLDEEAPLKSRLSGVPLSRFVTRVLLLERATDGGAAGTRPVSTEPRECSRCAAS